MLSKAIVLATAALSLVPSTTALYDVAKKTNLVMYWGQGPNQLPLWDFCNVTPADILVVGFINTFPSAANGLVGADYGNACYGAGYRYKGPGYNGAKPIPANDLLPNQCPRVQDGIPKCQKIGKKVLLSIGGAAPTWNAVTGKNDKTYKGQLKNAADGVKFADFLWGAYGPVNPAWKGPRPLDRGYYNNTPSITIDIDGFDFDIEVSVNGRDKNVGETAGYIAAAQRLRTLMDAQTLKTGKKYLLTASPQCVLNPTEANLDQLFFNVKFDLAFIQQYNQGIVSCTARARADKIKGAHFNYPEWLKYLNRAGSKSYGARIYFGLLGGPTGSSSYPNDFLKVAEVQNLISVYGKNAQMGGIMLWDATAAFNYRGTDLPKNKKYWHVVKEALLKNFPGQTKRDEEHLQVEEPSEEWKREEQHAERSQQAKRHSHMARHQHHS